MKRFYHNRRGFLSIAIKSSAVGFVAASPLSALAAPTLKIMTVGDVMNTVIREVPGAPFPESVDTLKSGTPEMEVKGIVTTMFPTIEVIRKTIDIGSNFIIAHEPTFYNHRDDKEWAGENDMIREKAELLETNKIALWRLHDYWHAVTPDGISKGLLDKLEWGQYAKEKVLLEMPARPLQAVITEVKQKLKLKGVRYIGQPGQNVARVCLLPGAWGGQRQVQTIQQYKPDLLICGEISEWECGEYVRDIRAMGHPTALLILGHTPSEEPGMRWLETWLKNKIPGLKINFIPAGDPYSFG